MSEHESEPPSDRVLSGSLARSPQRAPRPRQAEQCVEAADAGAEDEDVEHAAHHRQMFEERDALRALLRIGIAQ